MGISQHHPAKICLSKKYNASNPPNWFGQPSPNVVEDLQLAPDEGHAGTVFEFCDAVIGYSVNTQFGKESETSDRF